MLKICYIKSLLYQGLTVDTLFSIFKYIYKGFIVNNVVLYFLTIEITTFF